MPLSSWVILLQTLMIIIFLFERRSNYKLLIHQDALIQRLHMALQFEHQFAMDCYTKLKALQDCGVGRTDLRSSEDINSHLDGKILREEKDDGEEE